MIYGFQLPIYGESNFNQEHLGAMAWSFCIRCVQPVDIQILMGYNPLITPQLLAMLVGVMGAGIQQDLPGHRLPFTINVDPLLMVIDTSLSLIHLDELF